MSISETELAQTTTPLPSIKPKSNIENINNCFQLPISLNASKMEVNENIITDLELKETYDASGVALYNFVFQPQTVFGKKIIEQHTKFYTTDVKYLKDTQTLYKKYKPIQSVLLGGDEYLEIMNIWDDIKNDTHFKERYHYLEWNYPICESLNMSSEFLQVMSIYNLASPVMSLLMPIFILIIPFFVIQLKGLRLSMTEYIEILKQIAKNNAIGQLFTHFNSVSSDKKMYLLASAVFYIFSIYQNFVICIRFHNNMKKIHHYFDKIRNYIQHTEENVNNLLLHTMPLDTYNEFNKYSVNQLLVLSELNQTLKNITPYKLSMSKVSQMGKIMKIFYALHNVKELNNAFIWSFGMNGYIDTICGVIKNIADQQVSFCRFDKPKIKSKKHAKKQLNKNNNNNVFKGAFYPVLKDNNPIRNDIYLDKNLIITGPNASGKTTILKSSLINVILSQQLGCGFYTSANIIPYKYIHCYLNIPDTSGRDSLFQAEARRCKNILDIIHDNIDDTHFCVFDELYSGTNPEEAVSSATSFMKYLVKKNGVNCMLTTHFIDLCKQLENNKQFQNCHMDTTKSDNDDNQFHYTYTLKDGISHVRGGIKVLRDMDYPKEIIDGNV